MHIIRTAGALARALVSPIDPELKTLLVAQAERLAAYPEFAFEELAEIVVIEAGDAVDGVCSITGPSIVTDGAGAFTFAVELMVRHRRWIEATFILSDDGFGLVLLIEVAGNTDTALLALCDRELQRCGSAGS